MHVIDLLLIFLRSLALYTDFFEPKAILKYLLVPDDLINFNRGNLPILAWMRKSDNDKIVSCSAYLKQIVLDQADSLRRMLGSNAPSLSRLPDAAMSVGLSYKTLAQSTIVLLSISGIVLCAYKKATKRFRTAHDIPRSLRGMKLKGYILAVNDSDNVRFFHKNLVRLMKPDLHKKDICNETINIRLSGIDAPEMGHFGGVAQPFSREAKNWLEKFTLDRFATVELHRKDQYGRIVASVYIHRFIFFRYNVSIEMIRRGWATVYREAGGEYGGQKENMLKEEARAKRKKRGIWSLPSSEFVSPSEYKRAVKSQKIK